MEKSIQIEKPAASRAPTISGRPVSMLRPMAAPSSSARAVATQAIMALPSIMTRSQGLKNFEAASERHRPVTIPRWAALCWTMIRMTVERVTTQSSL